MESLSVQDFSDGGLAPRAYVTALGDEPPDDAIVVFVGSPLKGGIRVRKIDLCAILLIKNRPFQCIHVSKLAPVVCCDRAEDTSKGDRVLLKSGHF